MAQANKIIATDYPFKSRFKEVNGAKIHYIEEGEGDPILFLHGVPTSSYLWRNIIPKLGEHGRCIAPDLMGMGKSDKPDIAYRVFDQIQYIEGFITAQKLDNITLVMHGWGSVIGFNYAVKHPDNIKGIAFYESYIGPIAEWNQLALPVQHFIADLLNSNKGIEQSVKEDGFIEKMLCSASLRKLNPVELENYSRPFRNPEHRKPILQYLKDCTVVYWQPDVTTLIHKYSQQLEKLAFPKLMLFTIPGFITPVSIIEWCRDHLPKLTLNDLGEAMHLMQEYNPDHFSKQLAEWYEKIEQYDLV